MKKKARRLATLILIFGNLPAIATDFSVSNNSDSGLGSLRQAIIDLNTAGAGSHSIVFASNLGSIDLVSHLPTIQGAGQVVTINGAGNSVNGGNSARLLFVADGNVSIHSMTLRNGLAQGGLGGDGGGGGGGMDGAGGNGGENGGGGGGGLIANGGNGGSFGGGAGGGEDARSSGNGGAFGGGAGANLYGSQGVGGFGAGSGGAYGNGGNGGNGLGGAIFVREGGTLNILDSAIVNSGVAAGAGGTGDSTFGGSSGNAGSTSGAGIYLDTGITANIGVSTGSKTLADEIGGTGSIEKTGSGELVLSGNNTYTGATMVNAGRLAINGTTSSNTTVGALGELGGNGTIIGNVIVDGTLAPGNSIGQLNVTGNTAFNSGSVTTIEINDGGTTPGVNHDAINVTGNVTINGGSVNVRSAQGNYLLGANYTFITASHVTGTFDSIVDDLAFFDAGLGYTGSSVYFTLIESSTDYYSVAATGNQRSVGAYLDSVSTGASGDLRIILDEFLPLTNAQVQSGLGQLSGSVIGSSSQVSINGTTQMLSTIGQHARASMNPGSGLGGSTRAGLAMSATGGTSGSASPIALVSYQQPSSARGGYVISPPRDVDQWTGWSLGYGLGGQVASDGNAAGINYGLGGTTMGIDRFLDDSTRIGFFGGYVGSSVSVKGETQNTKVNGGYFGSLITHSTDIHYGMVMGGLQFDDYTSERTIQVGNLTRVASGDSDGWQSFTYGEKGLNLVLEDRTLQPFASLQYVYARQNAFAETGAGAMGLNVWGIDTHSLRSFVGSRLLIEPSIGRFGMTMTPVLRGSWMHEYLDASSVVNAQFVGVGGGRALRVC